MMWQNSPSFINGPHAHRFSQMPGFPRTPPHMLSGTSPVRHHVGSAPAVNPSLWERHAFSGQSPDTSSLHLGSPSFACFPSSPQLHPMEVPSRNIFSLVGGNGSDMNTSSRQRSSQEIHMFPGRNSMMSMPTSFGSPNERVRNLSHRRNEANSHNADRKQYELDIERILRGDDNRTTLMIKNIPNKYVYHPLTIPNSGIFLMHPVPYCSSFLGLTFLFVDGKYALVTNFQSIFHFSACQRNSRMSYVKILGSWMFLSPENCNQSFPVAIL